MQRTHISANQRKLFEEGEKLGLPEQRPVHQAEGLLGRRGLAGGRERGGRGLEARTGGRVVRRQAGGQDHLLGLGAPRDKGRDERDADAAADVAHQVEDAARIADLLGLEGAQRERVQRNEHEGDRDAAEEQGPEEQRRA